MIILKKYSDYPDIQIIPFFQDYPDYPDFSRIIPIFQGLSRFPENLSRKFSTLSRKIVPKSGIIPIFENPDNQNVWSKSARKKLRLKNPSLTRLDLYQFHIILSRLSSDRLKSSILLTLVFFWRGRTSILRELWCVSDFIWRGFLWILY